MRDDMNPFAPSPVSGTPSVTAPAAASPATPDTAQPGDTASPGPAAAPDAPLVAPAVMKFKSCRWRCAPEDGEFCTHRDVLPFAGKNDFKADSWCPECAFYKLRRTPKKREWVDRSQY
jgi:hypothetical protein